MNKIIFRKLIKLKKKKEIKMFRKRSVKASNNWKPPSGGGQYTSTNFRRNELLSKREIGTQTKHEQLLVVPHQQPNYTIVETVNHMPVEQKITTRYVIETTIEHTPATYLVTRTDLPSRPFTAASNRPIYPPVHGQSFIYSPAYYEHNQ